MDGNRKRRVLWVAFIHQSKNPFIQNIVPVCIGEFAGIENRKERGFPSGWLAVGKGEG